MKKRKICKTPNARNVSTLGKLKSQVLPGTGDNGIEILWDNDSPSPTTRIALAGKRRRHNAMKEENGLTDLSFVVQKFSENTSPVVEHSGSDLLQMWINKSQNTNDDDSEFTSPPFQTRYNNITTTPMSQRRNCKQISRKATKQFMLKIKKLVEEIQKSDLSSCSSQSQKECRINGRKRKNGESSTTDITASQQSQIQNETAVPGTTNPDRIFEDSFEWTEDDMDDIILTCQLSSSGTGSLSVPDNPKPHLGFSPSQITFVPETQLLSQVETTESVKQSEHAQEVPEQCVEDKWSVSFDDDDSLLATAALNYELSREAMPRTELDLEEALGRSSPSTKNSLTNNHSECLSRNSPEIFSPPKNEFTSEFLKKIFEAESSPVLKTQGNAKNVLEKESSNITDGKVSAFDFGRSTVSQIKSKDLDICNVNVFATSTPREGGKKILSLRRTSGGTSHQNLKTLKESSAQSVHTQSCAKVFHTEKQTNSKNDGKSKYTKLTTAKPCSSKEKNMKLSKNNSRQLQKDQENEFNFLLSEDNFSDDFIFEDVLIKSTTQSKKNNTCKAWTSNSVPSLTSQKKTYTKDEIEHKRLEAEQRRLKAKHRNSLRDKKYRI